MYLLHVGLRVKTLDRLGRDVGGTLRRYLLEGDLMELRFLSTTFQCLRWQALVVLVLFCLSLIYL